MFVPLLRAATVVVPERCSDPGVADADLVICGNINLAFRVVIIYLLSLLQPQLLGLQIKLPQGSDKLRGWLGRFVGLGWICWQRTVAPASTSIGEALFKVMARGGGHIVSDEFTGSAKTRLRFCLIF